MERVFQLVQHTEIQAVSLVKDRKHGYCSNCYFCIFTLSTPTPLCSLSNEKIELTRKIILRAEYEMNMQAVRTISLVAFVSIQTTFLPEKEKRKLYYFYIYRHCLPSFSLSLTVYCSKGTLFSFTTLLTDEIMCVSL